MLVGPYPVRRVVRGGYFGCGTYQNKAAWGMGMALSLIAIVLMSYGSSHLRVCLDEFEVCQEGMWERGMQFRDGEGPCYNKYMYTCQAPKWSRCIIVGLLATIGAAACLSFCCCCAPWPDEDEVGAAGMVSGGYWMQPSLPYGQPSFQETAPLVSTGYPAASQAHSTWPSNLVHQSPQGLELQQQTWNSGMAHHHNSEEASLQRQTSPVPDAPMALQALAVGQAASSGHNIPPMYSAIITAPPSKGS